MERMDRMYLMDIMDRMDETDRTKKMPNSNTCKHLANGSFAEYTKLSHVPLRFDEINLAKHILRYKPLDIKSVIEDYFNLRWCYFENKTFQEWINSYCHLPSESVTTNVPSYLHIGFKDIVTVLVFDKYCIKNELFEPLHIYSLIGKLSTDEFIYIRFVKYSSSSVIDRLIINVNKSLLYIVRHKMSFNEKFHYTVDVLHEDEEMFTSDDVWSSRPFEIPTYSIDEVVYDPYP